MEVSNYLKKINNIPICRVLIHCDDDSYIIQDMNYQTKHFRKEELKQAIKQGQLNVIDLQISKDNRLVKKTVDLKSVCITYSNRHPLTVEQQQAILFYGLAYINSNMTPGKKQKICDEIMIKAGIDADDLVSLFNNNREWTWQRYCYMDTQCRDRIMALIYKLAK